MTSSLFDCCGGYESYLNTKHIDGVKTFREVMNGDTLYYLDKFGSMTELTVTNSWHPAKGHFFITCGRRAIDFGPTYTANVSDYAPKASIAYYEYGIIGTTKECVIEQMKKDVERELETLKKQMKRYEETLKELI